MADIWGKKTSIFYSRALDKEHVYHNPINIQEHNENEVREPFIFFFFSFLQFGMS